MRLLTKIAVSVVALAIILTLFVRFDVISFDLDVGLSLNTPSDNSKNVKFRRNKVKKSAERSGKATPVHGDLAKHDSDVLTIVIDKQSMSARSGEANLYKLTLVPGNSND